MFFVCIAYFQNWLQEVTWAADMDLLGKLPQAI